MAGAGFGFGQAHDVIELDEQLKFPALPDAKRALLLLCQKPGDALFGGGGRLELAKLFRSGSVGDKFDDFLKWLHGN